MERDKPPGIFPNRTGRHNPPFAIRMGGGEAPGWNAICYREELRDIGPMFTEPGATHMELATLRDLLIEQLQDLYDAEHRLTRALPKMAKAASSAELKAAFTKHLDETRGQIERLAEVFEQLGEKPKKKACKAMQGLIEEGEETIKEEADPEVKDAALIAAAQRVEHYEMAGYGTVRAYARLLKESTVMKLLDQTYKEEKATDEALSKLAESAINLGAASPSGRGKARPAPSTRAGASRKASSI